jgi:Mn-dependent DtxR family transcriptional regulator
VSTPVEDVERWLMQVLYDNYDNFASSGDISILLDINESSIIEGLNKLIEAELVETEDSVYRLTEKGYQAANQRVTSFCPYL